MASLITETLKLKLQVGSFVFHVYCVDDFKDRSKRSQETGNFYRTVKREKIERSTSVITVTIIIIINIIILVSQQLPDCWIEVKFKVRNLIKRRKAQNSYYICQLGDTWSFELIIFTPFWKDSRVFRFFSLFAIHNVTSVFFLLLSCLRFVRLTSRVEKIRAMMVATKITVTTADYGERKGNN